MLNDAATHYVGIYMEQINSSKYFFIFEMKSCGRVGTRLRMLFNNDDPIADNLNQKSIFIVRSNIRRLRTKSFLKIRIQCCRAACCVGRLIPTLSVQCTTTILLLHFWNFWS